MPIVRAEEQTFTGHEGPILSVCSDGLRAPPRESRGSRGEPVRELVAGFGLEVRMP